MVTSEGNCSATFYVTPYSSAQPFKTFPAACVTRIVSYMNPFHALIQLLVKFILIVFTYVSFLFYPPNNINSRSPALPIQYLFSI
jgi:hypothetical protein